MREIYGELDARPAIELFYEAQHFHAEGLAAYTLGQIDLVHRARIDDLFYAISHGVRERLSHEEKSHRPVLDELNERLVDKYFVNFSVFESIPDVWAINQIFPIVPIERLNEVPTRRGVVCDLTCDSDGTVKQYVENESLDSALPLHVLRHGEAYRIGFSLWVLIRKSLAISIICLAIPMRLRLQSTAGGIVLRSSVAVIRPM